MPYLHRPDIIDHPRSRYASKLERFKPNLSNRAEQLQDVHNNITDKNNPKKNKFKKAAALIYSLKNDYKSIMKLDENDDKLRENLRTLKRSTVQRQDNTCKFSDLSWFETLYTEPSSTNITAYDRNDLFVMTDSLTECMRSDKNAHPRLGRPTVALELDPLISVVSRRSKSDFSINEDLLDPKTATGKLATTSDMIMFMPKNYPVYPQVEESGPVVITELHKLGHVYRMERLNQFVVPEATEENQEPKIDISNIEREFNAIVASAPGFSQSHADPIKRKIYQKNADYCNTPEGRADYIKYMSMLVRLQCEHAIAAGSDTLYATALGCGKPYDNNPYLVAAIYRAVLNETQSSLTTRDKPQAERRSYKDLKVKFSIPAEKSQGKTYQVDEIFKQVFRADQARVDNIIQNAKPYANQAMKVAEEDELENPIRELVDSIWELKRHAEYEKNKSLNARGHDLARKFANELYDDLEKRISKLIMDLNDPTGLGTVAAKRNLIEEFQTNVTTIINAQRLPSGKISTQATNNPTASAIEVFRQHRGAKQFLMNAIGIVLTFGIGLIIGIKNYIQKGEFDIGIHFFKVKTKTQKILENIENKLVELAQEAPVEHPTYTSPIGTLTEQQDPLVLQAQAATEAASQSNGDEEELVDTQHRMFSPQNRHARRHSPRSERIAAQSDHDESEDSDLDHQPRSCIIS